MADSRHITRRTALKGSAVLLVPSVALAASEAAEDPYERVRRLAKLLSEALVDVPKYEYAMVKPATAEMPVIMAHAGPSALEGMASFHLSEYRRAMQAIDPTIKRWTLSLPNEHGPGSSCRGILFAHAD